MIYKLRKKKSIAVELAPLIDIVFILLIFFAVSSNLVSKNQSIPLTLPQGKTTEKQDSDLFISITKDKKIFIDQQRVEASMLTAMISDSFSKNPSLQVILSADKHLQYEFIIHILDTIRLSGCTSIALHIEKVIQS